MAIVRVSAREGRRLLGESSDDQKYHAEPQRIDGEYFSSKGEMKQYHLLKLRQRLKEISGLKRQISWDLHACNLETGELTVIGAYVCDFMYRDCRDEAWPIVVEDWKGMATLPLAKWKIKHMKAEYGIVVLESRNQPMRRRRFSRTRR